MLVALRRIEPSEVISYSLFLILPIMLPFVRRAATPMLVIVGLYAGLILWRKARLGAAIKARLGQPVIWLFLAFMGWAALSLLWTPVPLRGFQSISSALLLVACALLIFEFPLSKNAPRHLAVGLSLGSAIIAVDLSTRSLLIHFIHDRPEDFRYNMVVVTFVVMSAALVSQSARMKPALFLVTALCLICGVFASQSETAKLVLIVLPIAYLLAYLFHLKANSAFVLVGLAAIWIFAAFGMPLLHYLKSAIPSEFWRNGAADERLVLWNAFTAFALAGLPWGWGVEATSAPEATKFVVNAKDAFQLGIVGRLHSHNNVLQIVAELGVPALVLAFTINAKLLLDLAKSHTPSHTYLLTFFATVLLIAIVSHGVWQSWWFAAVLIAYYFFNAQ